MRCDAMRCDAIQSNPIQSKQFKSNADASRHGRQYCKPRALASLTRRGVRCLGGCLGLPLLGGAPVPPRVHKHALQLGGGTGGLAFLARPVLVAVLGAGPRALLAVGGVLQRAGALHLLGAALGGLLERGGRTAALPSASGPGNSAQAMAGRSPRLPLGADVAALEALLLLPHLPPAGAVPLQQLAALGDGHAGLVLHAHHAAILHRVRRDPPLSTERAPARAAPARGNKRARLLTTA
eukprot:scaffold1209_cov350-Prasinococcus_capsulatus_cf.AAC.2